MRFPIIISRSRFAVLNRRRRNPFETAFALAARSTAIQARALILLAGAVVLAEAAQSPAKPPKPQEEPRYLQATVIDVTATVVNVTDAPRDSATPGLHLAVSAERGNFDVYLGPRNYLDDFEIVFHKGDRIQVIGSKLKSGDANVLLAREVRRGVATVYLRNLKGEPYWPARNPPAK